ncbi:hypothetical protein TTHERM_00013490 (macronuclear) [Tetrahymena thermophila SB210]|uniref:Uncharacterized protein n=1 Tax=Tetrahymena thermophila (strain SB210) TaxID=312017 RepID=Q22RN9_TETTS|nr:hypothetical protein TTHERM_00013490 [Tetrahymena thermophila SB210]EAR88083.1 hypothetical protein TTHERM_00013490 [Tetrahymena thermophila SB210]|eukprot:XP_001008328.1 hypothetical protein TTHERM_00013490 [Tetrahymena thermophila SB210]
MDDLKTRDSITSVIKQSFYQILDDPNMKCLKENEYSCNQILQRMTELFFDIFESERQTQSQQLKSQYTMLKEYCQNISHEKFEIQRELQNEILQMSEEHDKIHSTNAILNEEISMLKIKNEHLQMENKRIASEQEILICQINEQRATFQKNLEEMEMISSELKIELDLYKDRIKKLEATNEKQHQQIREYSMSIQKQQNKIKETENQYLIESQIKGRHLNELELCQKNIRELELLLRQSNEANTKQNEEIRLNQNQLQELDKQIKSLENQLNDKKKENLLIQKQHEQIIAINEENQKKFILNTVNKYKEKIQLYKNKLQEYQEKQEEQNKQIYQLQLQDNEEKNGYQKQIQHIESQISQVQAQYEAVISSIKQNSKVELENQKEGFEKNLQLQELQFKQEMKQMEMQMKDKIKSIEDSTISREQFEAVKKEKQEILEKSEKDKNNTVNELNNTIKQQQQQIEKLKDQISSLNYNLSQSEISQNKCRQYEEEIQKLNQDLCKKQSLLSEQKDKIKQAQYELDSKERENQLLQEDIKNLEEQNQEIQSKFKDIERKLNQQIKQLKDKAENQCQENYKLNIELREIRKEQEFEKKQNQDMMLLLEKRQQGITVDMNEIQSLRSNNIVLQGKLENLNAKLNDSKDSQEQIKKEKEYLSSLVEQQSKKLRNAEDLKIKFSIKIKQLMKTIQYLKEDLNNIVQKEILDKFFVLRKEYTSQIEEFSIRFLQILSKCKEDEVKLNLNYNALAEQFSDLKNKFFKQGIDIEDLSNQNHSPKFNERVRKQSSKYVNKSPNNSEEEEGLYEEDLRSSQSQKKQKQQKSRIYNQKNKDKCYNQDLMDGGDNEYLDDYDYGYGQNKNTRNGRERQINNSKNPLRKSYSDSKRFKKQYNEEIEEQSDSQSSDVHQKGRKTKRNKSEEKTKLEIEEHLKKQIELRSEKLLLEEYVMEDIKRLKEENALIIEERQRLIARIDSLSIELGQKQMQADSLNSQINILIKEAELCQQENQFLQNRLTEAQEHLTKAEDLQRINQQLNNQGDKVREECKEQNKQLIEQLQKEIAVYRQKELQNLQKIAQQEVEIEEKISQLKQFQTLSQQQKANFEFKTRLLSEQKEQMAQFHSQDKQITEYRDEIQVLLQENSQLLRQVQLLQTDIEGLHLGLEKAKIQIQIADQRENQLTNQNQQLQQEVIAAHLKVQQVSNQLNEIQLEVANEKLKMKQKQTIKKERQLMKEKLEQQNIKEIHQMIESSCLSLKKKNFHTYKSSIQLTSNFAQANNNSENTSLAQTQLMQSQLNNPNQNNLQFNQTLHHNQSLKLLNDGISCSPIQNNLQSSFNMISSNFNQQGLIAQSSQNHLQNITNSMQNRSQKNLSLHSTNTIFQTPNHNTSSYSNLINQNLSNNNKNQVNRDNNNQNISYISKLSNVNNPSYMLQNNFVRSGFIKTNNMVESDNNSQTNTSNNQSHIRGQSMTYSNLKNNHHLASTSSLLNNQNKYISSTSTNIPPNHTFNSSVQQNEYNQSNQKLYQSNNKSQSNQFASQNSNYNNSNNNINNNNQIIKQGNLIQKNFLNNDFQNQKFNQEHISQACQEEKGRGKSLSSNAELQYFSNKQENKLEDVRKSNKTQLSPKQFNQFTQNLNLSRDLEINPHPIKEELNKNQMNFQQSQSDQIISNNQRPSKYDKAIVSLNNNLSNNVNNPQQLNMNNPQTKLSSPQHNTNNQLINSMSKNNQQINTNGPSYQAQKIQSENDDIIQKLNKLQQLDQFLQRSRSQSSNANVNTLSVKSALNQANIPHIQFKNSQAEKNNSGISFNASNPSQLNSKQFTINKDNNKDAQSNEGSNNLINNTVYYSTNRLSQQDDSSKQKIITSNRSANITSPSQSLTRTNQNRYHKDDASTFTPYSNNNLQEAISFGDELINEDKLNIQQDYINQLTAKSKHLLNQVYDSQTSNNQQDPLLQQFNSNRRAQSFHNNCLKNNV